MFVANGTIIDGKYEIRGSIGTGGMGVVYEAYQPDLERLVALKILTIALSDDPDEVRRFEREAKILSKLSHPHIVQFYSYGIWQGYPYIAMERLSGDSLQDMMDTTGQALSYELAIKIARQVCNALMHAHAEDILHRDIKPSNVNLTITGAGEPEIKLLDFGLAKLTGLDHQQKLTNTGMAVGSVLYMSPEQCLGQPVDERTDMYGLGCLLFECLTGAPPFVADNNVAAMFQHLHVPPQQAKGWDSLTPEVQHVLEKCLAKKAGERYASAAELDADLQSLAVGDSPKSVRAKAVAGQPRGAMAAMRRQPLMTAGALVVALIIFAAVSAVSVKHFQSADIPGSDTAGGDSPEQKPRDIHARAKLYTNYKAAFMGGDQLENGNRLKEAAANFERANELLALEKTPEMDTAFNIKRRLANIYRRTGQFEKVAALLAEAMVISKGLGDLERAEVTYDLSENTLHLKKPDKALNEAHAALKLWESELVKSQTGNYSSSYTALLHRHCAGCWLHIASCHAMMGKRDKAEGCIKTALAHAQKQDMPAIILECMRALAMNQKEQNKPKEALAVFDDWSKLEATIERADIYSVMQRALGHSTKGILLSDAGQLAPAQTELDESVRLCLRAGVRARDDLPGMYYWQAVNLYRSGKVAQGDQAYRQYVESLKFAEKQLDKDHKDFMAGQRANALKALKAP